VYHFEFRYQGYLKSGAVFKRKRDVWRAKKDIFGRAFSLEFSLKNVRERGSLLSFIICFEKDYDLL
jgi:hypothetical protein